MARKKKKHICAECGEEFKHGIGLRKHQRQTGHKGSRIEEAGAPPPPPPAEEPAPAEAPAAEEPAPKPRRRKRAQEAAPEPAPSPEPVADEPVAAADPEPEDDDRTVAVSRPSSPDQTVAVSRPSQPMPSQQVGPGPTKMQHTKQKLNLVSRGLKVALSHRAKGAGQQLKRSAKSGADIFKEALKLAIALTCFRRKSFELSRCWGLIPYADWESLRH